MAIFLTENSRVIVQGMTGSEGTKHTRRMLASGTKIVGGVNARKAGSTVDFDGTGLPVFGTVAEAMEKTGADVSVLFVPPAFTKDAIIEAIDAQIGLAVVITEGVPVHDSAKAWAHAVATGNKTRIIGPNCPGIISPGKANAGIIPANISGAGRIGLVSKSGTLTYQILSFGDLGFSTAIGIGGDPIIGTTHIDALEAFEADDETDAIVMIGEIGGDAEERAAAFIAANVRKPVVGYVAGFTAPEGRPWAMPAPSCPVRPVPRRPSRKPSKPLASRSARRRRPPPGCCVRRSPDMSGPDGRYGPPAYRPAWESAPPKQPSRPDPAKLLGLSVAGLGGLNFIWGFLPQLKATRIDADLSVFAVGPAYVPILLLIAGLLAMAAFLPGSERSRLAVAAVSVGGAAGAIVSLGMTGPVELVATGQVSKGLGAILLVIFGIVQAVVAIAGYVVGADFSQRTSHNNPSAGGPDPVALAQPGWFGAPSGQVPPVGQQPHGGRRLPCRRPVRRCRWVRSRTRQSPGRRSSSARSSVGTANSTDLGRGRRAWTATTGPRVTVAR